jgi:hypothetical protein
MVWSDNRKFIKLVARLGLVYPDEYNREPEMAGITRFAE